MRTAMLALVSILACASAQAVSLNYYCTEGNPFITGISKRFSARMYSDDSVEGYFAGTPFSFTRKPSVSRRQGLIRWAGPEVTVLMSLPHPYDGLQDSQWGELSKGSRKRAVSCFPAR
jgi:hypothetical protein